MDQMPMYEMPLTFVLGWAFFVFGVSGDGIFSSMFCHVLSRYLKSTHHTKSTNSTFYVKFNLLFLFKFLLVV